MSFFVIIAAIAGLVWGLAFMLRGSLIGGCLVFLMATVCLGHEFLNFDLGPLPLTLDRLWMGVLLAMYFVQRRLGQTDPKPVDKVDLLLMAFLVLVLINITVVGATLGASKLNGMIWHFVVGYLFPALLYWFAKQSLLTESRAAALQGFLAIFGLYLGVTGILEMTGQWSLVWPTHIANPKVGLHFGRARGPMVQSVSYGLYLGICLISLLLWQMRFHRFGKLVLWLLVPILAAGVMLSLTRSVWIGTGLAVFAWAALMLEGVWRRLALLGMLAAAMVLVVAQGDNLSSFEREGSSQATRSSAESRGGFAYVSWQMFLDRPVFGFGFGQFIDAKLPYLEDRSTALNLEMIRPLSHHNTYLSLLVELGLVGLVFYLAILVLWARNAWRLLSAPRRPTWARAQGALFLCALTTYAIQMLFHEVSLTSIDNSIIFLLAGTVSSLKSSGVTERRTDTGRAEDLGTVCHTASAR